MYFTGITIAVMTFLTIGIWHPIVIKTEYRWGTRPWIAYLLVGLCCICLWFLTDPFVSLWLGPEYILPRTTLALIIAQFLSVSQFGPVIPTLERK